MLAIRLQKLGANGYPVYRMIVQEAGKHPSSGRVIEYLGSYNPHTKDAHIKTDDVKKYLANGAQPSPRVVKILTDLKVELPKWVKPIRTDKKKSIKKPDKLRKSKTTENTENK